MTTRIALLFAIAPLFNYGQNTQPFQTGVTATVKHQMPVDYRQQAIAFIKQVEGGKLANSKFILIDSSSTINSNNCLQYALADKQFYSSAELKLIESRTISWKCQWKKTDFPSVEFVKQDTVRAIFNTRSKNWDYFYKHVGPDFNEFSIPVFFRNNTFCLFYSANYCGALCAEGSLRLYKKQGNKWTLVKSYCNWVS